MDDLKYSEDENSAMHRFKKHLRSKINNTSTIESWVEDCLYNTGIQFNRDLQDIVNHIGELL